MWRLLGGPGGSGRPRDMRLRSWAGSVSGGRNDYPDPYKLPFGRVGEREAQAARAGRAAVDKFLSETTRLRGPVAGLVAAAHIQMFAFNMMLQKSGLEPREAKKYYEVIAICIGHTLGCVDFLARESEPEMQA